MKTDNKKTLVKLENASVEKNQKILKNLTQTLQKCGHDGFQKGVEKSTALATDFESKIGPQMTP